MNQRVTRIVELINEGTLTTAEDLLIMELNERAEVVKGMVTKHIVGTLFESSVSKETDLGNITLDSNNSEVRLRGVNTFQDALSIAPKFAAFIDGQAESKYSAKGNDDEEGTITVMVGGQPSFDMYYEGNELVADIDLTAEDLAAFKASGSFPKL